MRISRPPRAVTAPAATVITRSTRTVGSSFTLGLTWGLIVLPAVPALAQTLAASAAASVPAGNAVLPVPSRDYSAAELIEYRIVAGDTLTRIGAGLLENPQDWSEVRAINQIREPRRLSIGQVVKIPKVLLKSQPAEASLQVVTGGVQVNGEPARAGQRVGEAAVLTTGADGIVEIRLGDGSTFRLTPNSRLRMERLRRFHHDEVIEARTLLEQGRVEAQASPQRRKPLEIRTPFATAAVRGTHFRVGSQPELGVTEVLTGAIAWGSTGASGSAGTAGTAPAAAGPRGAALAAATSAGSKATAVSSGFGATGDRSGRQHTEALLPAPNLQGLPTIINQPRLQQRFAPVADASQYRVQIFADPQRQVLLHEQLASEPVLEFDSRTDGPLYLTARAISARTIEGLDQTATVEVRARPFAPAPRAQQNQGIVFEPRPRIGWAAAEGASSYQLQWAMDSGFTRILGEQTVTDATEAELPITGGQAREVRYWRVAGRNSAGGYLGPFSTPQTVRYYATPGSAPSVLGNNVEGAVLHWSAPAGAGYLLEVADNSAFQNASRYQTTASQQELGGLTPGRYFARLAATYDDGVVTPFSPVGEFQIQRAVRTSSGLMLKSGTGLLIQSP